MNDAGGRHPIVWWEVESPAPEVFQEFHRALWNWTFRPAFRGTELDAEYWIITSQGRVAGGLQRSTPGVRPQAGVRLYLEVDDLEATFTQVRSLGGAIERHRTDLGGNDRWFGTVLDPTGVSFGLWTRSPLR